MPWTEWPAIALCWCVYTGCGMLGLPCSRQAADKQQHCSTASEQPVQIRCTQRPIKWCPVLACKMAAVLRPAQRLMQSTTCSIHAGRPPLTHGAVQVIAHRLSTVQSADEVAVVSEGVIAERAPHAELLAAGALVQAGAAGCTVG